VLLRTVQKDVQRIAENELRYRTEITVKLSQRPPADITLF
jgi:hypothetical protein